MIKRLNLIKIFFLAVILAVLHFAVGIFISPSLTQFVITRLNEKTAAKITLDKAQVWPLAFNVKLFSLKVFDPDNPDKRIINIPNASLRLSLLGLLSKRLVISHAVLNNAEISLEARDDGSFNVQDIVKRSEKKPLKSDIKPITKEDVFGRVYSVIRDNFSKKPAKPAAQKRKPEKPAAKTVKNLPQGKIVRFETTNYLLEIGNFDFNNAAISFKSADGNNLEINEAKIQLKDFGVDPKLGVKFGAFIVNAALSKDKAKLGGISAKIINRYLNGEPNLDLDIQLKEVNLEPLDFIYRDSLPVLLKRGIISLNSKTAVSPDSLNSRNDLQLKDYFLSPKKNFEIVQGFAPINVVCDALNKLGKIDLSFNITGTPEQPDFKDFQRSLNILIKPVLSEIGQRLQEQGFKLLEDFLRKKTKSGSPAPETQEEGQTVNPVDILKSIFGGEENSN